MIEINNISFTYSGAAQKSLDGVSLSVREGECVLITGQSGCGKSTLTRIINGLCPKFYGGTLEGSYTLCGRSAQEASLSEIGRYIGSVFQDPRSQFFSKRVRDEIVLAMENHCLAREVMYERLMDVSESLDISHLYDREMRTLSSGEKQKVAIASVCALEPKGLVLDEPSANLDTNATAQLSAFLSSLKAAGHTLVISEHRLHYLKNIFDRVIMMMDGKIVREYTREQALSLSNSELTALGLRLFDSPAIDLDKRIADYSGNVLKPEKIGLRINENQILSDITLGLHQGKVTAVTGSNSAGKTSICRVMTGLQKESVGMVCLHDLPTKRKTRIRNTFFVQQDVDYQLYMPSVEEEILLGSSAKRGTHEFNQIVKMLGLQQFLKRHPNTLSGGQKQRVLIAAAVLRNAPVMVLDEPTSGLDGYHMRGVSQILRDVASSGKAVFLVTHDMEFIQNAADSIAYMHRAKMQYHSTIKFALDRQL